MAPKASVSAVQRAPAETWDQGDVVEGVYFSALDDLLPAVLLTPSCDVEHDKVQYWTFAALFPDTVVARALAESERAGWGSGDLSKAQEKQIRKLVSNLLDQRVPRYHWLPVAIAASQGQVIDFACVSALPVEEVRRSTRRVTSLCSSWREQVAARYVSFMGRIGTDEFHSTEFEVQVDRVVAAVVRPA